jgi:hemerythrin-like domain-containing protein
MEAATMRALQVLSSEHAVIAACSARLEAELEAIVIRSDVDVGALERLVRFFEEAVDGQHQEKEERIFLPRLFTRAHGRDAAALRTLLDDHGAQRAQLVRLREELDGIERAEPAALPRFVQAGRRYLRLQAEHSRWEQLVLFPFARRILGPSDDRAILNGFRRLDEVWGTTVLGAARALAAGWDRPGRIHSARRHELPARRPDWLTRARAAGSSPTRTTRSSPRRRRRAPGGPCTRRAAPDTFG